MLTFAINYLLFKIIFPLFERIFVIISESQCFSTRKLWNKQRSSSVNPTTVTKLQFSRIKQNLSTDEELRNDAVI